MMDGHRYDVAVVGCGMLGSSAARRLADAGCDVVLIGQPEPADHRNHAGVFASHHDSARVCRTIDPDPLRAWLAQRSVEQFEMLTARTGISCTVGTGHLWVEASEGIDLLALADERFDLGCSRRPAAEAMVAMSYLSLAEGLDTMYEPAPAGYVDPRAYVRAEVLAAVGASATVVDALVGSVTVSDHCVEVGTDVGSISADRALLATGAFSGHGDTPLVGLDVEYALHTQLYVALDSDEADRLSGMPSIIAKHADPTGDFYLTPPVPDPVRPGHHVLKIGMPQDDHVRVSAADLSAWYRTDGDPAVAARLDGMVRGLLPGLRWTGRWTGSCVTTYTPTGHPAIDWVGPGVHAGAERIACCVGGNGYAAKCAPSLGGLAAGMLLGDPWPTEVDRDQFRARFRM